MSWIRHSSSGKREHPTDRDEVRRAVLVVGAQPLCYVLRAEALLAQAARRVTEFRQPPTGSLTIAASGVPATYLLHLSELNSVQLLALLSENVIVTQARVRARTISLDLRTMRDRYYINSKTYRF